MPCAPPNAAQALASVQVAAPFRFLRACSGILLSAAHLVFAVLFLRMVLRQGEPRREPTLLSPPAPRGELPAA